MAAGAMTFENTERNIYQCFVHVFSFAKEVLHYSFLERYNLHFVVWMGPPTCPCARTESLEAGRWGPSHPSMKGFQQGDPGAVYTDVMCNQLGNKVVSCEIVALL